MTVLEIMGDKPNKYHVTDEGVVYRVDDNGEITELGNVDSLGTIPQTPTTSDSDLANDSNLRHTLSEMERLLCNGKGKGLNRFERKLIANDCSNVPALECFVEFCGSQWVKILIARFERGETFLEPVLLKAAQTQLSSAERLASCKRSYSSHAIYQILDNYNIPQVKDALKANPNSPYHEADFVPSSKRSGGCLGIIILFILSTALLVTTLI